MSNIFESVIHNLVESDLSYDLSEYQKWVDYDMKRYHRISKITQDKLDKAGLEVVKDEYGDYEVIAKYDESLKESVNSDAVSMIKKKFPGATVRTIVRKYSDIRGVTRTPKNDKTKMVQIKITPDDTSSINSILQYCNHTIKKVLDRDTNVKYYYETPARSDGKSVILEYGYGDYSDLSDELVDTLKPMEEKADYLYQARLLFGYDELEDYLGTHGSRFSCTINTSYTGWPIVRGQGEYSLSEVMSNLRAKYPRVKEFKVDREDPNIITAKTSAKSRFNPDVRERLSIFINILDYE